MWQNNTGAVKQGDRFVRFGQKGSSDLIGLTSDGRILCIEVKVGRDKLSQDQIRFRNLIELLGGRFIEARSVKDAIETLDMENLPQVNYSALLR